MTRRPARRIVGATAVLAALMTVGCGDSPPASPDGGGDAGTSADAGIVAQPTPACDTPSAGQFCDVTVAAGIGFEQLAYQDDPMVGGVGLVDVDGDGRLDLYVVGFNAPGALYRNTGGLTFEDSTVASGLAGIDRAAGVAAADADGDGDQDLVILVYEVGPRLYLNDGNGQFTDGTAAAGLAVPTPGDLLPVPTSAAFADVDGDGRLDLYVGHWSAPRPDTPSHPNQLFLGGPGGVFSEVGDTAGVALSGQDYTLGVAFADVDDDGDQDLWVVNDFGPWGGAPSRLLVNQTAPGGPPVFFDDTAARGFDAVIFGMGATPADFDGDGDLDFHAANFGRNVLARNDGSGAAFTDVAVTGGAGAAGYADPLAPIVPWGTPPSLHQATSATFAASYLDEAAGLHTKTSWGGEAIDYDNDGDLDLFVGNGVVGFSCWSEGRFQPDTMLENDGAGQFDDVTAALGIVNQQAAGGTAAGDLDGDGDLDLVIGSQGRNFALEKPVILRNDAPAGGRLVVRLVGVASNRDGIGARVTAEIGARVLVRHVSGGYGFASSSPHEAWFGLDTAPLVDRLTIVWPSGTVDVLLDVAPGALVVTEGSSP